VWRQPLLATMKFSFQTRIVLFFSVLFISVQLLTVYCAYRIFYDNSIKQLHQNLIYAEAVFKQILTEGGERMASETRILVADFGFRTTVSEGDAKTIASALENLTLRIRGQRAFYVDLQGKVVADTAGRIQGSHFIFPQTLREAEQQGKAVAFGVMEEQLYEWAIVPVLAPIPIGWVAVAVQVDNRRSDYLKQLSAMPIEVTLLEHTEGAARILSSSLSLNRQEWLVSRWLAVAAVQTDQPEMLMIEGAKLMTHRRLLPSADNQRSIFAVLQIDYANALEPYWFMLYASLTLLLFGLTIILLGCILIARKVSQPLRELANASERMMNGQFDLALPVTSQDELGRMSKTFNRAAELATQMFELKQKDEVRREMVATVSHDLRNPLTVLHGFLETLQLKADHLPEHEQQRYLQVALRQSEKVSRLAQELFELAKLECDETCIQKESFCIAELIQDVVQKFQLSAEQKVVELSMPMLQGLPPIHADIGLIERLLTNLLDNALRNTPSGGKIRVNAWVDASWMRVSLKDTGIGIPAEYLNNLFDWSSPLSHRARSDAGGFGLVIVAKILSLHGGTIQVESTLGKGSNFCFALPLKTADQEHDE
jgi:signal transduction histidine kinase